MKLSHGICVYYVYRELMLQRKPHFHVEKAERRHVKKVYVFSFFFSVCAQRKGEGLHPHNEGQWMQQLSREMWQQAAGLSSALFQEIGTVPINEFVFVSGVLGNGLRLHGHRDPRAHARRRVLARTEQNGQVP